MAGEPNSAPDAFDIRSIRQLVKLMNDNELAEIDLRSGMQRIRLKKRGSEMLPVVAAPTAVATAPLATPAPPANAAQLPPTPTTTETKTKFLEIKSPMLGTFYRSPSPDAEPFVQVGSHVDNETVVCIIEAMKVFNEITADCSGKIVAVLVESAQPIEYGQVLFRVDPNG
jgi:acetyl-CoA carboxylase biotin carboxyl carrier protein